MIDDVLGAGEGRRDIEVPLLLPGECLEGADATTTDLLEDVALVKLDGTQGAADLFGYFFSERPESSR
ncbi:hypothetical protein P4105_22720 [Pseudomonas aeruginosa]|nr:hypothetical protein [Pseudomonas aeruginosa]